MLSLFLAAIPLTSPAAPSVDWFEGSLAEALVVAGEEQRLVLVEFHTDWERDCARLRETLADESVTAELTDTLCVSVDAEGPAGALLAYRHRVSAYPTLLFFEPDGTLRERLKGHQTAAQLALELQRIDRNEGTLRSMRDAVEEAPGDLDLRYDLALKLGLAGDQEASDAEIARIKALDPEGTSRASLRIGFDEVRDRFYDDLLKWKEPDWEALSSISEEIDDDEMRFRGLAMLAFAHDIEGVRARNRKLLEEVQPHLTQSRAYYKRALEMVPEQFVWSFANEMAWNFWEDSENLSDEEKVLALRAAEMAAADLPDDTSIMDTLACCLFMNGESKRALEVIVRCRELDPARDSQWDEREVLFSGE